ncbi:hypothetical protein BDK51DRAFT_13783, partial [Blyttiomyces helicus]
PWRETSASLTSQIFFNWMTQIIVLGAQKPLEASDLWDLSEADSAAHIVDDHYKRKTHLKTSFVYNLLKGSWFHVTLMMTYSIASTVLALTSPFFLNTLIKWISDPNRETSRGWSLLAALVTCLTVRAVIVGQLVHHARRASLAIRAISVDEIYQKTLRRSASIHKKNGAAIDDDASVGKIVTLVSIDAERIREYIAAYSYRILDIPLSMILSFIGLFAIVGWAAFAGLAVIVVLIPAGSYVGKIIGDLQETLMEMTDNRVNAINEMLQGIRAVKYFAWEPQFINRITAARSAEVAVWTRVSIFYVCNNLLACGTSLVVAFVTFTTYTLVLGNALDSSTAFTCIALLAILNRSIATLPWALGEFFRVKVSLDRASRFLAEPELDRFEHERAAPRVSTMVGGPVVGFRAASFRYHSIYSARGDLNRDGSAAGDQREESDLPSEFHLRDIDVEFPVGRLSLVMGATGSGKSSLILALSGVKMKCISGKQHLPTAHPTAYVAQSAWIMNATIRDNILFGARYDAKRYQETIEACALIRDLETLEGGDLTEIGDKGVNLSGGQKARISLARAAYSRAPILLLDDPLSAVDAPTAKNLLHHCLLGALKNRTVILVSHAVSLVLPHVYFAVVLGAGCVVAQGTPDEIFRNPAAEGVFRLEPAASSERRELAATETIAAALEGTGTKLVDEEEKATGTVAWTVYWTYFKAAGGVFFLAIFLSTFVLENTFYLLENVWVQRWTDGVTKTAPEIAAVGPASTLAALAGDSTIGDGSASAVDRADVTGFLAVYGAIGFSIILVTTAQLSFMVYSYIRAGTAMHQNLLRSILGAPMRFFEVTPIGRILNRFSKDTESIDNDVVWKVHEFASQVTARGGFKILFIVVLIAFEAPIFIAGMLPLTLIYYLIAKDYLLTSRDLKRLESVSRSPLFSQFSETLAGVETVRAFGAQGRLVSGIHDKIDLNHRAYFLMWSANRWLCIRTDMIGALVTLAAGVIVVAGSLSPGMTGLVLVYALE